MMHDRQCLLPACLLLPSIRNAFTKPGVINMKCPACGAAQLLRDTRNMPYTYKGQTTPIPSVSGNFCSVCGEVVLNREEGDRYSELIGRFQKHVDNA